MAGPAQTEFGGVPRALTVAVVAMGVLLVLGTIALVGAIVWRRHAVPQVSVAAQRTDLPNLPPTDRPALAVTLDEPPGTRIAAVAPGGSGLLAFTLSGGGLPDRVVLVDPARRAVVGRISLAR